jgi:di/tricarboxylate transporter
MTPEIALVLGIVTAAVILFVTERIRVDLVALMVLAGLAVTGLVTPAEALSGFSNPAVVTVWAVFILSAGLSRAGVANVVGRQVLRVAGDGEARLLTVIMLTAGVMSAFMNNVGVAALLLPVVMDIARRTQRPPSRLLIPLAFGSLLGGLTTLIGTPPNILISDALRDNGLVPFGLFDYAPVGIVVMLAGIAFMVLVGRHLLPTRDIAREFASPSATDLGEFYHLSEELFTVRVPPDSPLNGRTLGASRMGAALGLNVLAVIRDGQTQLAPNSRTILQAEDRLLVQGRRDKLGDLTKPHQLVLEDYGFQPDGLTSPEVALAEVNLASDSSFVGQTLSQIDFRRRFGVNVLAVRRDGTAIRTQLEERPLHSGDILLLQGTREQIKELDQVPDFEQPRTVDPDQVSQTYRLQDRLIAIDLTPDSLLAGKTLVESRLGGVFDLTVVGIIRDDENQLMPSPETELQPGDTLLVKGRPEALLALQGLDDLELDRRTLLDLGELESENVGLAETVLSPHSKLAGKNLREIHFREKYGITVLAILRGGEMYHTDLAEMPLQFGDALLLYGSRQDLRVLSSEPDFLILTPLNGEILRPSKAPVAVSIMGIVLLPVILGWLPIAIAAVIGASLMILTDSLSMDEAYTYIEWKAVFLIAGMLPLGIAMDQTGAALFLAEKMISLVGGLGPLAVIATLFILAALTSQVMPNPAVAVLLAPIALSTAGELGISPYALMMTVAISTSASFLSPVAHPANLLVLGPGGYRFSDYIKVGLPLTLVVLVVVLLVLPIFWPLTP